MKRAVFVSLACLLWCSEARAEIKAIYCTLGSTGGVPTNSSTLNKTTAPQGSTAQCFLAGSWLDTTNQVTVSGSGVVVGIVSKGGGPLFPSITLRIQIATNATPSLRTIKMSRPALGGTDSDSFGFTVLAK